MLLPTLFLKKLSIMTNQIPRIVAIVILIVLYAFTVPFSLNDSEKRELAKDFKLTKSLFSYPTDEEPRYVRNLHPQYQEISTWISSVGASVAFADLVLPAAGWLEKEGTMTNSERRISYLPKEIEAPGEARPDVEIFCEWSICLFYKFSDQFYLIE